MRTQIFLAAMLVGTLIVAALAGSPVQAETEQASVSARTFHLPKAAPEGEAKQVTVLVDDSHLKLATVVLRNGTALPAHSTPVPATIQVLGGEGLIHVGGEAVSVSAGTILFLAAGEEHDVVPLPGSDMSLLVHYLRAGATSSSSAGH